MSTVAPIAAPVQAPRRSIVSLIAQYSVLIAFVIVVFFFAVSSPTFLTWANIQNVLVNNVALLAVVALGMTLVIASGGIDLSVGASIDM